MSYGILYRAIALKHPIENDKFLILSEYGDNNVWEVNNRRRARSWAGDCIAGSNRGAFCTASELEAKLRTVDFDSGCYAVYGGRRDFASHWRVYKKAIKNAVAFDQLPKFGLYFSKWVNGTRHSFPQIHDLENLQSEQSRLDGEEHSYYLNCYVSDWDYSQIYPKKRRVSREPRKGTHIISVVGYGYLTKRSARRIWHTYYKSHAKQYSEKEAIKLAEILNKRGFGCQFVSEKI